jgi:hypothetical protein
MGLFDLFNHDDAEAHYNNIYMAQTPHHHGSLSHEGAPSIVHLSSHQSLIYLFLAIAGAAGFAAMRAYEAHLRASGQQPSHALMKVHFSLTFTASSK